MQIFSDMLTVLDHLAPESILSHLLAYAAHAVGGVALVMTGSRRLSSRQSKNSRRYSSTSVASRTSSR